MYNYEWDTQTGGYVLTTKITGVTKEVRPVFWEELSFLEMDKNYGWVFPHSEEPLMWAEGRRYIYRGEMVAEAVGGGLYSMPVMKNVVRNLEPVPVDIQAMIAKNDNLLNGLVQRTLKGIYSVYEDYRNKVDMFYAAFSGGKDSVVMLDLVQRALPHDSFSVVFGDTTMELSDTYQNVEESRRFWPDLNWNTARTEYSALDSWQFAGPPARTIRWCCGVHKSAPSVMKIKEILAEKRGIRINDIKAFKVLAFLGVRAEESEARSTYSMIADGNKHTVQINCNPILEWGTCELFIYYFSRELPLNKAYRHGLPRVGCLLCPMSTSWTDCLHGHAYPEEVLPYIDIIKSSIDKKFEHDEEWNQYLEDGGWKTRAGGKILSFGETRVQAQSRDGKDLFFIKNPTLDWKQWMRALGDFAEVEKNRYSLQHGSISFNFEVDETDDYLKITYFPLVKSKESIHFLYLFKNVLYKSAYCKLCGECMAECPNGSLTITRNGIKIENCLHCGRCLDKQKGCIIARSLIVGGENNMDVRNIDRYRTFGYRQDWLEHFFEDAERFWTSDRLGKDMYTAFKCWGKESLLLNADLTPSPLYNRFVELGADSPALWGYLFANMAYNSPIITWYIRRVPTGTDCSNDTMMILLGDELNTRTRSNALAALKDTLKASPVGWLLGQGDCEMKGKSVISIARNGWMEPEPMVMLYTLYLFAEHSDGLYSFTLSDLMDDSEEREAMSPNLIFGVDAEALRPILQGLAHDYAEYIQVDFNNNLMENIFLNREKSAADIAALL